MDVCEWCEGQGCDECLVAQSTTMAASIAGTARSIGQEICDWCEGIGCDECGGTGFISSMNDIPTNSLSTTPLKTSPTNQFDDDKPKEPSFIVPPISEQLLFTVLSMFPRSSDTNNNNNNNNNDLSSESNSPTHPGHSWLAHLGNQFATNTTHPLTFPPFPDHIVAPCPSYIDAHSSQSMWSFASKANVQVPSSSNINPPQWIASKSISSLTESHVLSFFRWLVQHLSHDINLPFDAAEALLRFNSWDTQAVLTQWMSFDGSGPLKMQTAASLFTFPSHFSDINQHAIAASVPTEYLTRQYGFPLIHTTMTAFSGIEHELILSQMDYSDIIHPSMISFYDILQYHPILRLISSCQYTVRNMYGCISPQNRSLDPDASPHHSLLPQIMAILPYNTITNRPVLPPSSSSLSSSANTTTTTSHLVYLTPLTATQSQLQPYFHILLYILSLSPSDASCIYLPKCLHDMFKTFNNEETICPICADSINIAFTAQLPCGHAMCFECFSQHIAQTERSEVLGISCPCQEENAKYLPNISTSTATTSTNIDNIDEDINNTRCRALIPFRLVLLCAEIADIAAIWENKPQQLNYVRSQKEDNSLIGTEMDTMLECNASSAFARLLQLTTRSVTLENYNTDLTTILYSTNQQTCSHIPSSISNTTTTTHFTAKERSRWYDSLLSLFSSHQTQFAPLPHEIFEIMTLTTPLSQAEFCTLLRKDFPHSSNSFLMVTKSQTELPFPIFPERPLRNHNDMNGLFAVTPTAPLQLALFPRFSRFGFLRRCIVAETIVSYPTLKSCIRPCHSLQACSLFYFSPFAPAAQALISSVLLASNSTFDSLTVRIADSSLYTFTASISRSIYDSITLFHHKSIFFDDATPQAFAAHFGQVHTAQSNSPTPSLDFAASAFGKLTPQQRHDQRIAYDQSIVSKSIHLTQSPSSQNQRSTQSRTAGSKAESKKAAAAAAKATPPQEIPLEEKPAMTPTMPMHTGLSPDYHDFICPCGAFYCTSCQHPGGHFPLQCEMVSVFETFTDPNALAQLHILGTTKQCPKCLRRITKDRFCNHITCLCRHEFCWQCKKPWNTHSGGPYTCSSQGSESSVLEARLVGTNNTMSQRLEMFNQQKHRFDLMMFQIVSIAQFVRYLEWFYANQTFFTNIADICHALDEVCAAIAIQPSDISGQTNNNGGNASTTPQINNKMPSLHYLPESTNLFSILKGLILAKVFALSFVNFTPLKESLHAYLLRFNTDTSIYQFLQHAYLIAQLLSWSHLLPLFIPPTNHSNSQNIVLLRQAQSFVSFTLSQLTSSLFKYLTISIPVPLLPFLPLSKLHFPQFRAVALPKDSFTYNCLQDCISALPISCRSFTNQLIEQTIRIPIAQYAPESWQYIYQTQNDSQTIGNEWNAPYLRRYSFGGGESRLTRRHHNMIDRVLLYIASIFQTDLIRQGACAANIQNLEKKSSVALNDVSLPPENWACSNCNCLHIIFRDDSILNASVLDVPSDDDDDELHFTDVQATDGGGSGSGGDSHHRTPPNKKDQDKFTVVSSTRNSKDMVLKDLTPLLREKCNVHRSATPSNEIPIYMCPALPHSGKQSWYTTEKAMSTAILINAANRVLCSNCCACFQHAEIDCRLCNVSR